MKKVKGLFAVMLILCLVTSTVNFPVVALDTDPEVTKWKSSDYLDPDNPVTENNPWSLESTNNAANAYEVFDGTTKKESAQALFPQMPDGVTPETAYIVNGGANWGNQGYNMAVNGKYMIPASIYSGTSGDDIKTASGKLAKVFTAPKAGTLIITAGEINGDGTEGHIAAMTLAANSWDAPRQNWNIIKDGEILATANGASRESAGSYDLIAIDDVTVDVAEGDKIYFEFAPSAWTIRADQAIMWDPVVEYAEGVVEGEIVDDTDYFLSSKYLDPERPYIDNPWAVESTNNYPDKTWQVVTNTTPHTSITPLFPEMPDGESPEIAYVTTGDFNNGWGSNSVNTAVNGKYMVGGTRWNSGADANVSATAKIAKVFTAPKNGWINITAEPTMGEGSEGFIVPVKTESDTDDDGLSWTVVKDGETLWTATGNQRVVGNDYDKILFGDMIVEINEGDKIYFVLNPQYGGARSAQACLWDPAIEYITLNIVDDTDIFASSKYLNPDEPYIDNPWSLESTNNALGTYEVFNGTTKKASDQALFPEMPDGESPETAYIVNGEANWSNQGYNMAVNGKYMIPASIYSGTSGDDIKTTSAKLAKVFTAPKAGKIKITALATNGEGTEGKIATMTLAANSWDAPRQNWNIIKDGEVLVTANGASRESVGSYDLIAIDNVTVDVAEGDKIYFEFAPSAWSLREKQACMWDPQVKYVTGDEDEDEDEEGEIVDDTIYFLSSKYLDPEKPYKNNPWTVESNNNLEKTWQTITNKIPREAEFDLFPVMPDGMQPTTAYVQTGDINTNWGANGVNIAVSGKYMVGASIWYNGADYQTTASCKIAKVFVAPADGKIKITAAAVMGDDSHGRIVPVRVTDASSTGSGQAWILEKNDAKLWSASGNMREMTVNYDYIEFADMTMTVKAGDKLRFVFQPLGWSKPRQEQACIWDPAIEYISFGSDDDGEGGEIPEENDPNSFLSSYYLDPDDQKENSPWTVESTNNNAGEWGQITNTTPRTDVTYPLFPVMPDGEQPTTGYVQTGEDYNTYWSTQGFEMAINGKYIIPAAFWTNDTRTAKAKISKLFTAPKTGMIRITAEAVMGGGSEHLIVPAKVTESWETSADLAWIVEKNGVQIWKRDGTQRDVGEEYDFVRFDPMIIEVNEGDKLRFIFQPKSYAERANMACMWDPRVTYIGDPIFLAEDSKDKSGMLCPVDHTFELTLTGEPLQAITSEDIVISGGKAKAVNVSMEGKVLKFGVEGLVVNSPYDLTVKNIVYAVVDDEPYISEVKITFNTTDVLSLGSDIYAEDGLSVGDNSIKTTVVCSDTDKIASGDEVIMIASILNADGTVHSVKLAKATLSQRITPIECEVSVASGQAVRVWVVDSLGNIKPIGGKMTDITQ